MKLVELTWPEVQDLSRDIVVVYPIGALEQHSRHLPLFTDSLICEAVALRVEAALSTEVLLLPVQWLGASAHHLGMPGSLSADAQTLLSVFAEPIRCLMKHGFRRAFVLNGHGGNTDVFHLSLRLLKLEFPEALLCGANYWDLTGSEIRALLQGTLKEVGHACEFETAIMLHLRPDLVRRSEIADDLIAPRAEELRGVYFPLDMKRQTKHGGHGEATKATALTGQALFDAVVAGAIRAVTALRGQTIHDPAAPP